MMRKSTLARLMCLALLAVLAFFGAFTLTAQPAHALWCDSTFAGCGFSYIADYGTAICCIYQCPNGSQLTGLCEPV